MSSPGDITASASSCEATDLSGRSVAGWQSELVDGWQVELAAGSDKVDQSITVNYY